MEGRPLPVLLLEIPMGSLVWVALFIAIMVAVDVKYRLRQFQDQAVEKGFARWVQKTDGNVVFRWGPPWVN